MRLSIIAVLLAAPLAAQSIEARGRKLADEIVAALGGDRFMAMKDRIESGRAYSFYREQMTGLARAVIYTRYLTVPDPAPSGKLWLRERQNFGKDEDYGVLFNETGKGWSITFRGARPMPEESLSRYEDTTLRNVFYIFRQRMREPGMIFEARGREVVDNQPMEVLDITDAGNRSTRVFVHYSTKLPFKQTFQRMDPKLRRQHEEVTFYSKYRDLDGVQWPYVVQRTRDGGKVFELYSETVQINQNLSDDRFLLPSSMKVLPPAR